MNNEVMEIVAEAKETADIRAKGEVSKLPRVKKAIIGRASVNSYGRNALKGQMVSNKYEILITLGEDYKGFRKGDKVGANVILNLHGCKTFPIFTDFEKAKAACKRVSKWGKEPETPVKRKEPSKSDILKMTPEEFVAYKASLAK